MFLTYSIQQFPIQTYSVCDVPDLISDQSALIVSRPPGNKQTRRKESQLIPSFPPI